MNAVEMLQKKGIRPSIIRIMVLEYLLSHRTHPTVEEVYEALLLKAPTISKTSIYNTLHLLAQNDIILEITIDPAKVRYDADTSLHGHFKCDDCLGVWDFAVGQVQTSLSKEFDIKTKEIYFTGLCDKCKNVN
ncbi:MAG: transcriptional repressor [Ruminococcaceae bacterium]|nr:transcriptional repressor [Oscillospiraceae bacterium]